MMTRSSIDVIRFILLESGTYNPIYSRPYQTYVDQHALNSIYNRVDQTDGKINSNVFAGVASSILTQSATPQSIIPICQGWNERRIRFMLEVMVTLPTGSNFIYYVQGYTSHLGVSDNGAIDPQMCFYINSIIRVNRSMQATPFGAQVKDVITESAHLIDGRLVNSMMQGQTYMMRPRDVFTGIQANHLQSSGSRSMGELRDTRFTLNSDALGSSRANSLPANYLAKVVDSWNASKQFLDFGQGEQELTERAKGTAAEIYPNENAFIRALNQVQGVYATTSFTFRDLEKLDGNVKANTNFVKLGVTNRAALHQVGQTEYWNGANRETQVATILSNTIPALMMESLVSRMHFRSTNHDATGAVNTVIINALSLTNMDVSSSLEMFKRRLQQEVLYDITFGNQELYALEMNVDLFGDTSISISLNNGPMITYVTPSFCDSLLTPVMTQSKDNYFGVVNDMETILNNLPNSGPSASSALNTLI